METRTRSLTRKTKRCSNNRSGTSSVTLLLFCASLPSTSSDRHTEHVPSNPAMTEGASNASPTKANAAALGQMLMQHGSHGGSHEPGRATAAHTGRGHTSACACGGRLRRHVHPRKRSGVATQTRGRARPDLSFPRRAGPEDCPTTVRPTAEVASASMAACDVAGGGDTTPSQPPPRQRAMGQIQLG
jgi:hypothetical protein